MLKAVVEKLDDIPESLHAEYILDDKDKKYYLDLDDSFRTHSKITPLSNTLGTLKEEAKQLKTTIEELRGKTEGLPDDFDPNKYRDIVEELENLKKDPGNGDRVQELADLKKNYEDRIKNLEQRNNREHADKVEKLNGHVRKLQSVLDNKTAGDELTSALVAVGVKPELLKAAKAMLRTVVKVVVENDTEERRAVVDTDLGEVDVRNYIETWARSEEGKPFIRQVEGGGAEGSGGRAALGKNPFSHEGWNVTEQGRLVIADPQRAQKLAAAAGTSLGGMRPPAPRAA